MIRALVIDDEPLARERVRTMLETHDDFAVIGECANGIEARETIASLRPHVIFLDIEMPRLNGISLVGLVDTGVCGTFNVPQPDGYGLANGTWIRKPAVHTSVSMANGGLCSTASDLVRWSHILATGGVMLPASYATMTTPTSLANNTVVTYGFGVNVRSILQHPHPAVFHSGIINGFQSFLVYFPDKAIAVAVINTAFPAPPEWGNADLVAFVVARAALAAL